jgi:cytochrome c biogenesis protein CcmG, thiol:disulfide interchange protein DsbE
MPLRALLAAAACALAPVAAGCGGDEGDAPTAPPRQATQLRQQPGLVGGGLRAYRAQLDRLRGTPVVVNQWASWCGPCKFEFPFLRSAAERYAGRVAFLGVNARDGRAAAQEFLRRRPVPFPSFFDPGGDISRSYKGDLAMPTTVFYDRRGKVVERHYGAYPSEGKLDEDIRRHALGRR